MSRFNSNLDHVRVAAPCSADWDSMWGDERVRFCGQCKLNVYNLSEMKRSEAELLVARAEGRLCVRYFQRRDGSIITKNCPVGLLAIKRRLTRVANAIGSTLLSFFAGIGAFAIAERLFLISVPQSGEVQGVMVTGKVAAPPPLVPVEIKGEAIMGDMMAPVRPKPNRAR